MYILRSGYWYEVQDLTISGANYYGYQVGQPDSNNASKVRAYRADGQVSATIKFRAFILGQVAQINPFQWSSSEQVWPFEKDASGRTLYCKEINFGSLPNSGTKSVAHSITWDVSFNVSKLHNISGRVYDSAPTFVATIPYAHPTDGFSFLTYIDSTNLNIVSGINLTDWSAYVRIIYAK